VKRIVIIGFMIYLFSLASYSQGIYSSQNLAKASDENLELYLEKALKTTRTGAIFSVAGSAAFVSGLVIASVSSGGGTEESYRFGLGLTVAGFCSSVIGLPILITGTGRIRKVMDAKNSSKGTASINLVPCTFNNYETQYFHPGIGLRIRFQVRFSY
jgi:hypothetical protein